jgi:hypothetical protein
MTLEVLFKRRGNDWRYTPVVLASFLFILFIYAPFVAPGHEL